MGWGAGEGREAAKYKERAHMGTFFVLGCRGRRLGQESHWTRKTHETRMFFMSGGGESAGEGGGAVQHKGCAHMGMFFVLGCRGTGAGELLNTKNTRVLHVFHVLGVVKVQGDAGRGRGAAEHEKHARLTCFSCPGDGESAGEGSKAAQHEERAQMAGDKGWGRRAAKHKKRDCVSRCSCSASGGAVVGSQ